MTRAHMLEIWGRNNSLNVQKVLWCCQELGLSYQRIDAGGTFGRTDEPGYRALNPTGRVPTIVDDGFALWESNAIVRYLARQYGGDALWPASPRPLATAEQWMDWQAVTLWPCFRPVFIGLVRTPQAQRDEAAIKASIEATAQHWSILDAQIADNRYIAGFGFGMADIALGTTVNRWFRLDIARGSMPYLQAWYERLLQRPAYQNVVASIPLT